MEKTQVESKVWLYPKPAFLVGANVDGKPNFMVAAGGGSVCIEPTMICVPFQHSRYTLKGIRENMTFSVNLPSVDMVKETDYCGIVSGSKVNKAEVCGFNVFYGKLDSAPLIEQCPVTQECKVVHILDLGSHALVIGEVLTTYVSDNCFTDGKADIRKINTMVFSGQTRQYLTFGDVVADAYSVGKELKTGE